MSRAWHAAPIQNLVCFMDYRTRSANLKLTLSYPPLWYQWKVCFLKAIVSLFFKDCNLMEMSTSPWPVKSWMLSADFSPIRNSCGDKTRYLDWKKIHLSDTCTGSLFLPSLGKKFIQRHVQDHYEKNIHKKTTSDFVSQKFRPTKFVQTGCSRVILRFIYAIVTILFKYRSSSPLLVWVKRSKMTLFAYVQSA